ncbi:MAG: ABC transporter ATP-binding protein [Thaumarchaeota archaeon]|jgi:peptide/nickel transport system ATP-binding protein|nr:ABC transporter ATP-binding protein [Nitrososphaerota archaeon]
MSSGKTVLSVRDLKLYYRTRKGVVKALEEINFDLEKEDVLAVVGESGCGKSTLARALVRVLPRNIHTYEGKVFLNGRNVMELDEEAFRREVRWKKISIVFQGAMNSFNPVYKIGQQVAEPLVIHDNVEKKEALKKARQLIELMGMPGVFAERYPFELSGGMKQRAAIAMALITNPEIVILDEPTSALDVLTQANIINLLKRIKNEFRLSYIFITHDLGLASELANKVAVIYAGKIVELSSADVFYTEPKHPYSRGLIASVPTLTTDRKPEFISGAPPSLIDPPSGCRFHPRCRFAWDKCSAEEPGMIKVGEDHLVRCWLYGDGK